MSSCIAILAIVRTSSGLASTQFLIRSITFVKPVINERRSVPRTFKKEIDNDDSIAAELIAFSNSKGGKILFGIEDKKDFNEFFPDFPKNVKLAQMLIDNKNFNECRECHIEPDWLLVYKYTSDKLILLLVETGSHSELFKK